MSITAEQLQRFCSTHDIRAWTLKPNTVGAFTYATNMHIAIRIPAADGHVFECHSNLTESMVTKLDEYMSLDGVELGPLNLPPEPAWATCPRCHGTGKCRRCGECNGEGELECDLGHMHRCEDCNGRGQVEGERDPCMECEGSGRDYNGTPVLERSVLIGAVHFDWRYLSMIADLPGAEVGLENAGGPLSEHRRLLFRFAGDGRGIVMPLIPNSECR